MSERKKQTKQKRVYSVYSFNWKIEDRTENFVNMERLLLENAAVFENNYVRISDMIMGFWQLKLKIHTPSSCWNRGMCNFPEYINVFIVKYLCINREVRV